MRLINRALVTMLSLILSLSTILIAPFPTVAADSPPGDGGAFRVAAGSGPEGAVFPDFSGFSLDKGNPKLDSALNQIVSQPDEALPSFAAAGESQSGEAEVRVVVESTPDNASAAWQAAAALGVVETQYNGLVQVKLPVSQISQLAAETSVKFVRLPYQPLADTTTSEGVGVINATAWQNAGYRGSGVKIAVLDVGFAGYTTLQNQGELPANLITHWFASTGGPGTSIHGAACAEIVYDTVPDATLYLVNYGTDVELGNAVDWLIGQGVSIVSSSVGFPGLGPGNGSGPIDDIVNRACNAGIFWSQAAGNNAQRHWSGDWIDADHNGILEFGGSDEYNAIKAKSGDSIRASLNWNDGWGTSSNDYNLVLFDQDFGQVQYSANVQNGQGYPFEFINYNATYNGYYFLVIATSQNPAPRSFNLYSYNHDLSYRNASGSICVPADSSQVLTVGAVPWNNSSTIEPFSSQGPNTAGLIKPDLVAPDFVSTATYGPAGFPGTSAAAPCAAGAAALVKQIHPTLSNTQIKSYLESHAVDLGPSGDDNTYGSGRLMLPVKIIFTTASQNLTAGVASTVMTIQIQDAAGSPENETTNMVIQLASSSSGGRFDLSSGGEFTGAVDNITVLAGANSASFFYKDTQSGSPVITASGTAMDFGSQQESVAPGAVTSLNINTAPVVGASVDALFLTQPVIKAIDSFGNPVSGVTVTVSRATGTGSLRGTLSAVTEASGLASFSDLGYNKSADNFTLKFAVGNVFVDSLSLGPLAAGAVNQISLSTQPEKGESVDVPFLTQPIIRAVDQYNNPTDGVPITASIGSKGTGALRGYPTAISDQAGQAAFMDLGYTRSNDPFILHFKVTNQSISIDSEEITGLNPGAAKVLTVETKADGSGTAVPSQALAPGDSLTVYAVSHDQFGNLAPNPGVAVWSLNRTGEVVDGDLTDMGSSAVLTAHLPGTAVIQCSSGSLFADSGLITIISSPPDKIRLKTSPIVGNSVDDNFTTQPIIFVSDKGGNPVSGISVTAARGSGSGTLRGILTVTTDIDGLAAFTDLGYNKAADNFTIKFSAGTLTAESGWLGELAPGAVAKISVQTEPGYAAGATVDDNFATQPVILVVDRFENPKDGIPVTASVSGQPGALRGHLMVTSSDAGLAAFSDLGYSKAADNFTIHFRADTLTADSNEIGKLSPGAVTKIGVQIQPSYADNKTVDDNFTAQPVILTVDQFANPKDGVPVTVSLGSGSGFLRGTLTAISDKAGLAAFSDLGYSKSGEPFKILFSTDKATAESLDIGPLWHGKSVSVSVETAADGQGALVAAQDLTVGNSLTVHAIARDQYANFADNAGGSWSLINIQPSVLATDLVPGAGNLTAVFTAHAVGSAIIRVSEDNLTSTDSGLINVVAAPAPPSNNSGGGGGSVTLSPVTLNGLVAAASLVVSRAGVSSGTAKLKTPDGKVILDIADGTRLLTANSAALTSLSATALTDTPAPPDGNAVVLAYTFGPTGARFTPAITLTFDYDPADLPKNVAEKDLYLAYYDGAQWQTLEAAFDTQTSQGSVKITHFSAYALMGKLSAPATTAAPAPSPSPSPSPTPTPSPAAVTTTPVAVSTTITPTPTQGPAQAQIQTTPALVVTTQPAVTSSSPPAKNSSSVWIVVVVVVVVVVLALLTVIMVIRRKPGSKGKS